MVPISQLRVNIETIQVLLAFMITAYATLTLCIAKTLIDYEKPQSPSPKLDRWTRALEATIVSFSDQQLVTGISIIIGGFSQLQSGIPVHHWLSVINQAWFSTMTHLVTFTTLRSESLIRKPTTKFRVAGMGILIVMLICAMAPIGYVFSKVNRIPIDFPAWCLYHHELEWKHGRAQLQKNYNWVYQTFAFSFLLFSFLTRSRMLLSKQSVKSPLVGPRFCKEPIIYKIQAKIYTTKGFRKFLNEAWLKLTRVTIAIGLAGDRMYCSKTWEVVVFVEFEGALLILLAYLAFNRYSLGNNSYNYSATRNPLHRGKSFLAQRGDVSTRFVGFRTGRCLRSIDDTCCYILGSVSYCVRLSFREILRYDLTVTYFTSDEMVPPITLGDLLENNTEAVSNPRREEQQNSIAYHRQCIKWLLRLFSTAIVADTTEMPESLPHLIEEQCSNCDSWREIKDNIRANKWFNWLCRLLYFFSVAVVANLLYIYLAAGAAYDVSLRGVF